MFVTSETTGFRAQLFFSELYRTPYRFRPDPHSAGPAGTDLHGYIGGCRIRCLAELVMIATAVKGRSALLDPLHLASHTTRQAIYGEAPVNA